ncbi:MAG: M12 family metallo-peptidase [Pseudomonadota bacterium]|nr:M12 family metallo-peptidase [Pseudomonadota bacterium]
MEKRSFCLLFLLVSLLLMPFAVQAAGSPDGIWEEISVVTGRDAQTTDRNLWIKPEKFRRLRMNEALLAATLNRVRGGDGATRTAREAPSLTLPAPDGRFVTVIFQERPVMAPELAARYPGIRTFTGYVADDPGTTVAFDWTPLGFHAQALAGAGPWYVDPYIPGESYASYYKRDYRPGKKFTDYPARANPEGVTPAGRTPLETTPPKSDRIRIYRLALGGTAEYARYHCGGVCADKVKPLAAMATTISRVNQIYRRELAIEFNLVAGNDKLIFLDPMTAPFTNGNNSRLLEQAQKVIDREIGDAGYDLGHVVSTSDGGLSTLGSACQSGVKAMAVTGLNEPKGDAYDVDFVCHELGHQFNADHTYNGKLGLCSADQYAPLMAYEPGSGVTIMSYCGQCDDDSFQFFGEPTFHSGNFDQIQAHVAGRGKCYVLSDTANTAPVVQAGPDVTIPRGTPFSLNGSATDADGDPLVYLWEEFDRSGVQAMIKEEDDGRMPLFRLYRPASDPARTFPALETVAAGLADKAEKLPQFSRTMNFRLIARDGRGGVAYGTRRITVDGGTGPLRVTAPSGGAVVPPGVLNVKWEAAQTELLPGGAAVDILLSMDGGLNFNPTPLLAGAPNNGAAAVTLPNVGANRARIMVKAANSIFFAVSPGDFTISGAGGALSVSPANGLLASGNQGGPFDNGSVTYTLRNTGNAEISWSAAKSAPWLSVSPASGALAAGEEENVTVSVEAAQAATLARDQHRDAIVFTNVTNGVGTTRRPVLLIVGQTLKEALNILEADGFAAWGFTGGPFAPSVKTFTLQNQGLGEVSWSAVKTAGWLTLSAASGIVAAGETATVTASIDGKAAAGMDPGLYTADITFSRNLTSGAETVAVRSVSLVVAAPAPEATLAVSPAEGLAASGCAGGPFAPKGRNYVLRNVGRTELSWSAAKTANWVDLTPAVGTLGTGESVVVAVTVNAAASSLAAGAYSDTISFANATNGSGNATRPATLAIATGPGVLAVTAPNPFAFSGPRGGPIAPAAGVALTLQNTGGTTLDWVIYVQEPWLEAAPFQGVLTPGAAVAVKITANDITRALGPGVFKNYLYFANKTNGMGNSVLGGQATIETTPAAGPLTVTPVANYSSAGGKGGPFVPESFDFTLKNTGAAPLDWECLGDATWLNVSETTSGALASGAAATFIMAVNDMTRLLSANNYRGVVYFLDKTNKRIVSRRVDLKVKAPGDVTGDGMVNLSDAIASMKVQYGLDSPGLRDDYAASGADVNGDDKVGAQEAVHALQVVAEARSTPAPYFLLKSGAFRNEQPIPVKYMAHGLSPVLSWTSPPAGTKSFVLIVEDPDELSALRATRNYWIVYDIPAGVTSLAEGAGMADGKGLPAGAKHGVTSWDKDNAYYHGLEPTSHTGAHRFIFRLFALSVAGLSPVGGATQDKIEAAMAGKVLGICELTGVLSRP